MGEQDDALLRRLMADLPTHEDDASDQALLDSLRADRRTDPTRTEDNARLLDFLRSGVDEASTELDPESGLRSLGYNYKQRDAILRPTAAPKPMSERHRRVQVQRFRWHLNERVDWSTAEDTLESLVGAWVDLSNADLDLALCWWDAGADPGRPDIVSQLIDAGFSPRDLTRRLGRRSIVEELRRGSSVEWCLMAIGWRRPRR